MLGDSLRELLLGRTRIVLQVPAVAVIADGAHCAVVNGVRVLSQQGFLQAIGRARAAKGGQGAGVDGLPAFIAAKNLKPFINDDLVASTRPLRYITPSGAKAYGYRAELLPKVCRLGACNTGTAVLLLG